MRGYDRLAYRARLKNVTEIENSGSSDEQPNPALSPNFEIEPRNNWADNFHRFAIVSLSFNYI